MILPLGIILDVILPVKALQNWELKAFDKLMQLRPYEKPDSRLLIIEVTGENLQKYSDGDPIHNETLAQLIEKLEQYQPKVIGLNILRKQKLENDNKLIYVCNYPLKSDPNRPGNRPPKGVSEDRVGFSDVIEDSDGVIRRHLLFMKPGGYLCQTPFSFSFLLAAYYLEAQGIYPEETPEKYTKFNKTILKKLTAKTWKLNDNTGVYGKEDLGGYQLLLNYRLVKEYKIQEKDRRISPIAETWTLDSVLENKVSLDYVRDKIIIIGSTADIGGADNFSTPYSYSEGQHKEISAVELHAQMVSQIISAVLDNRPLLSFLPKWSEVLWIWSWIVIGASIAWIFYGKWSLLFLSDSIAIVILVGFCWGLLSFGYWIPSVRSVLALIIASGGTILFFYKFG